MILDYTWHETPIGPLLIAGRGETVHRISFPDGPRRIEPDAQWVRDDTAFSGVRRALDAYFEGTLTAFDCALAPEGTPFQQRVWSALTKIPYGTTVSYGEIAAAIGRPTASRAVGAANGANPIPIIVPCHRVVGANGTLTGFGGGLGIKSFLLELEGAPLRKASGQAQMLFS